MAATVELDAATLVAALRRSPGALRRRWERVYAAVGQTAQRAIVTRFRSALSTTATATKRRSGALARSVDHRVLPNAAGLEVGYLGSPPIQARVQEGFDARGQRVSQFIIRPRTKQWLSWVGDDGQRRFAKRVVLRPRPALPTIQREFSPVLARSLAEATAREALGHG